MLSGGSSHTDFAIVLKGVSLIVCVWKLKGLGLVLGLELELELRVPALGGGGPMVLLLKVGVFAEEDIGEPIDPKREGKESVMGDRELGSKVIVERTVREMPLMPSPPISASCSSSLIGVGGVGVRGGAGMGRLEAIVALNWLHFKVA